MSECCNHNCEQGDECPNRKVASNKEFLFTATLLFVACSSILGLIYCIGLK